MRERRAFRTTPQPAGNVLAETGKEVMKTKLADLSKAFAGRKDSREGQQHGDGGSHRPRRTAPYTQDDGYDPIERLLQDTDDWLRDDLIRASVGR